MGRLLVGSGGYQPSAMGHSFKEGKALQGNIYQSFSF
jgi:hypothetical protein